MEHGEASQIPHSTTIDFEITPEYMDQLIEKHGDSYAAIDSFNFNIFEFASTVGRSM